VKIHVIIVENNLVVFGGYGGSKSHGRLNDVSLLSIATLEVCYDSIIVQSVQVSSLSLVIRKIKEFCCEPSRFCRLCSLMICCSGVNR
jgi:hypothetical protein